MQLNDLVERAEKLYHGRGSEAGLEALEAYSKGEIPCLSGLEQVMEELEASLPPFHPLISVVANSPADVRACDVFRLLSLSSDYEQLGAHLMVLRPDLKEEITVCLEELREAA